MTFQFKLLTALFALCLLFSSVTDCNSQDKVRVWKSTDGKFSVKAELVENLNGNVSLKRTSDGKVIKVPVAKLSAEDQAFLSSPASSIKKATGHRPSTLKSGEPFPTAAKDITKVLLEKKLVLGSGKFSLTTEKDFTPTFNDTFGFAKRIQSISSAVNNLKNDKRFAEMSFKSQAKLNRPDGFPSIFKDVDESDLKEIDEKIAKLCEASREEFQRFFSYRDKARKHADKILESYSQLEADNEVIHLIEAHNAATGKSNSLGPSKQFEKDLARFKKLESAVIIQKFPIRKEDETYFASIKFRGRDVEMVVDPTSEHTIFTDKLYVVGDKGLEMSRKYDERLMEHYKNMGMEPPGRGMGVGAGSVGASPGSSRDAVTINKPDGSSLKGRKETQFGGGLSLGNFVISNFVVLDPEFDDEPARLGGDFLREFHFELLEEEGQLKLMRLSYVPE